MVGRKITVGGVVLAAVAASMAFFPTSAVADYGPTQNDVVGVGSDTLQQLADFVADGDFTGNSGYNSLGNKNKFISIDATADANTRLAYGPQGLGPNCAPGTGGTAGTGNNAAQHADAPCVLNPTVVLRAGFAPEQRPNGSGPASTCSRPTRTRPARGSVWSTSRARRRHVVRTPGSAASPSARTRWRY